MHQTENLVLWRFAWKRKEGREVGLETRKEGGRGRMMKRRDEFDSSYHDWKVVHSWLRYLKYGLVCMLQSSWLVSSHFYPDGRWWCKFWAKKDRRVQRTHSTRLIHTKLWFESISKGKKGERRAKQLDMSLYVHWTSLMMHVFSRLTKRGWTILWNVSIQK